MHGLQQAFPVAGQDEALKMALQGGAGSPDDTPIFVVGLPRSGSTLVEQILASHPSVYGAGGSRDVVWEAQGHNLLGLGLP